MKHRRRKGGDYTAAAGQLLDDRYDYKGGKVFFKPTPAAGCDGARKSAFPFDPGR